MAKSNQYMSARIVVLNRPNGWAGVMPAENGTPMWNRRISQGPGPFRIQDERVHIAVPQTLDEVSPTQVCRIDLEKRRV